jgi:poly-gamma-glutamate synthesis protein (capsule biosynthesis protein)
VRLVDQEAQAELSILVAGDLCPVGQLEDVFRNDDPARILLDVMPSVLSADISLVNLECPLTNHRNKIVKSGPNLRSAPQCAKGIKTAGFKVATLANNHAMDMGAPGLFDTLSSCKETGLYTVGAGKDWAEATQPLYLHVNGICVALLAIAEQEYPVAWRSSAGVWPLDPLDNYYQIKKAKLRADFVLVVLHGGHEYFPLPSPRMVKTCRYLVDSGANAVICHHIHVPSGVEIYRGAPIVYSTGNFLFDWDGPKPESWYTGYLVSLDVMRGAAIQLRLIPYWQCRGEPKVRLMSDTEAARFLQGIAALSETIADEAALIQEWDRFCLSKQTQYLSTALSLTRVERRLLKAGIWPSWRLRRAQIPGLLNSFTCESHRDVTIAALQAELKTRVRK